MTATISNITFCDEPNITSFSWTQDNDEKTLTAPSVLLLALVGDGIEIEHGSNTERQLREDRIFFWTAFGLATAFLADGTVTIALTEKGRALVGSPEVTAYVARELAEFATGRADKPSRYRKIHDRRGCLLRKFTSQYHRLAGFFAERAGIAGADFMVVASGWYLTVNAKAAA